MGLRNWLHNKHMTDPVDGMLQLTSCSAASDSAVYANCHMQGVVTVPGQPPVAVEHKCIAPTSKWPQPGQTIPVRIDRADATRLEVRWDDMPSNRERGRADAQRLAEQMQSGQMLFGTGTVAPSEQWGADLQSALGGPELQSSMRQFIETTQANAAAFTQSVLGAPGRPVPGAPGGGLTPEQAAQAVAGRGGAGMQQATARVLAVHDVPVPPGMPGAPPAGLVDLTLDVALPEGGGYSTTMRIGFRTPERRAKITAVGATLPVLVNPQVRDQIAIDTQRLGLAP